MEFQTEYPRGKICVKVCTPAGVGNDIIVVPPFIKKELKMKQPGNELIFHSVSLSEKYMCYLLSKSSKETFLRIEKTSEGDIKFVSNPEVWGGYLPKEEKEKFLKWMN